MKKSFVLLAILLVVCLFLLSGCGLFAKLKQELDQASALVETFCNALAEEDYATARDCLHPNMMDNNGNFAYTISQLEPRYGVDFSDGIELKLRTSFSSSFNSATGSEHELTYRVSIGDVETTMTFVIKNNTAGYGIYSFTIGD